MPQNKTATGDQIFERTSNAGTRLAVFAKLHKVFAIFLMASLAINPRGKKHVHTLTTCLTSISGHLLPY